jgi:hypothetical protein
VIRYSLRCAKEHRFDSWFGSSADFERLREAGHLACAVCGEAGVEKDLMAPGIAGTAEAPPSGGSAPLSTPASPAEQALAELRRRIEATSENVGRDFVREARRIHEGEAPARSIIGEARPAEARALVEDGIPVAPLPWSTRRGN